MHTEYKAWTGSASKVLMPALLPQFSDAKRLVQQAAAEVLVVSGTLGNAEVNTLTISSYGSKWSSQWSGSQAAEAGANPARLAQRGSCAGLWFSDIRSLSVVASVILEFFPLTFPGRCLHGRWYTRNHSSRPGHSLVSRAGFPHICICKPF